MESIIQIYTDGGCSGNPGPGGWAYIIFAEKEQIEESGGEKFTTNNRMELAAVINALDFMDSNENYRKALIKFYTDSQYVKKGITEWIKNWLKNGWKTASKKPVKNKDLWEILNNLNTRMKISWNWVKGHSDNEFNNRCDSLVQEEIKRLQNS